MNRISLKVYPQVAEELDGDNSEQFEAAIADIVRLQVMVFRQKTLLDKLASLFAREDRFPFEEEIRKILSNPRNRMTIELFYQVDILVNEVQFFSKDSNALTHKVELKYYKGKRTEMMSFYAG